MKTDWKLRIGESAFGAGFLALGLFIVAETVNMTSAGVQAGVGPKLFPFIIAAGAIVIGLVVLRSAAFGEMEGEAIPDLDWRAVALILAGLAVELFVLTTLGWIIAAALLFVIGAMAFSSRRPLIDLALGLVISTSTYFIFSKGLGLDLPAGILAGLIGGG